MKYSRGLVFLVALVWLLLPTRADAQRERVQVGRDIEVGPNETVGEAVCIGCSIRVQGIIRGEAVAVGGGIDIDGEIHGDVVAVGGDIRLGPNANVGGNVVSAGGAIDRDPQAKVEGEITASPGPPAVGLGGLFLLGFLFFAVISIVLVLLAYLIAGQQRVETVASSVRERAGMSLLTGLGVLVGAILLYIIASKLGPVTPVLAVAVSLALVVTLLLGYAGLSAWVGRGLLRSASPLVVVLLGAVVITFLQLIPFLGLLVCLVFFLLALGSAAFSGYGTSADWLARQFATRPAIPPPAH